MGEEKSCLQCKHYIPQISMCLGPYPDWLYKITEFEHKDAYALEKFFASQALRTPQIAQKCPSYVNQNIKTEVSDDIDGYTCKECVHNVNNICIASFPIIFKRYVAIMLKKFPKSRKFFMRPVHFKKNNVYKCECFMLKPNKM